MDSPLLATKLFIPPPRAGLVPRPRLVERLDEGLRIGRRMTLVSAPAGFGKTTLIADWITKAVWGTALPVCWLSLDDGDNDPASFFTYLVAALERLGEGTGQAARSLLGSPQMPPADVLAAMLVEDLTSVPTPFVLVLDDYQAISSPSIHRALLVLLEHAPPQMHVVVATRTDPPLPLPRLRVREQMTEIRADELRFTPEEAALFLGGALGPALDAAKIAALEARTEGWAAGLQLAALSMRGREDIAGFVEAFGGSNRHIIDYLADEVLARQPEEIRVFLRQTSVLDRFCAPLCDAVSGSRVDSQAMLRELERRNLFLVPLDERREWFRYHHLFTDFLRAGMTKEQSSVLHLRAARWFEAHGLLPEAVHHVLAHAAATGETDEAVRVITLAGARALSDGALVTLLGWLDALPDAVVRATSRLSSYKAWALLMTGQSETAEIYLTSAEVCLPEEALPADRGRILGLRCAFSGAADVVQMAPRALELMGDADPLSRTSTLFMLGDAQDAVGDAAGAEATLREAHRVAVIHGHRIMAAIAQAHMAISIDCQGRHREAVDVCRQGIEQYRDARDNPLPIAGLFYVVLGELAYDADSLEDAHRHLKVGLELGRQSATMSVTLYALASLALVQSAMGSGPEALATIREAQDVASRAGEHRWRKAGAAIEADLRLRQGDTAAARRWADDAELPLDPPDQTRRNEYTTLVRVLLASGRAADAQALLAGLDRAARKDGRLHHLLTIQVQQALAEHRLGNDAKALESLTSALRFAAPRGYVRAFLDEGPALHGLLVRACDVEPDFVDALLAAFEAPFSGARDQTLREPLSSREREVLRRLASGGAIAEIARDLFVAESTVRSHVKHIYVKLDVHSRYEALERGKALGLLQRKGAKSPL